MSSSNLCRLSDLSLELFVKSSEHIVLTRSQSQCISYAHEVSCARKAAVHG